MGTGPTNPGSRAIAGVATSTTAFVGRTRQGPTDAPVVVTSVGEFERQFGGLWAEAPLGYSVRHYFENGGRRALICRIDPGDGHDLTDAAVSDPSLEADRRGLWMLDRADAVNVIVIPPLQVGVDVGRQTWDAAVTYADRRGAMLIIDPPAAWAGPADVTPIAVDALVTPREELANAALYVPRIRAADPLDPSGEGTFAPGGAVAGVWARTDEQHGVWKSPAGRGASLVGVTGLTATLSDHDNGPLNARGINALRSFPSLGHVVWGARTLRGADALASEWKYVAVRRTALFLEASIERGTEWAVFEPNDEPLWAQLRGHIADFLVGMWRQGAFPGRTPRDAFFAKCDASTTTRTDIDDGRLNILVGFAPLKPAEFVLVRIQLKMSPVPPARRRTVRRAARRPRSRRA